MRKWIYIALGIALFAGACKHEKSIGPDDTTVSHEFPDEIANIIVNKCATVGCHNAASYTAAGGLLLDSWIHLFEGGSNGAVVVPYSPENSSLLYFINTDDSIGITATPTMPYNETPLSKEEYSLLKAWVERGAPDKNGNIPFAENAATRQKIYVTQQGCDLVGVIDAEQQVIMRYIKVGKVYASEQPNNIVMSADGRYAYVSFWGAGLIQKINTDIDSVVAETELPRGYIKAIQLNNDGTKLIATNWYDHKLVMIDVNAMQVSSDLGSQLQFLGGFTPTNEGGYMATSHFGNTMYRINTGGNYSAMSIDGNPNTTVSAPGTPDPYRVLFQQSTNKYFISCTNTNEVRVWSSVTNEIIATIPVGGNPQEMVLSTTQPYLFVTCMNDTSGKLDVGSVYVINYNTHEVVKRISDKFFQPNGMAVDDRKGLLYVFSRNDDKNGPPPHHSGPCSGRNGFYQVYDIFTLERYNNRRYEVSVDPFAATTRFR